MPKKTAIVYDPKKTIEELAAQSGCSVAAVRKYIRTRGIDRAFDQQMINFRAVQQYRKSHPNVTQVEAANDTELSLSLNTIKKYWNPAKKPRKERNGRISTIDKKSNTALMMTVSEKETTILQSILTLYLDKSTTFDCDLTMGAGGFYKELPTPKYCYDKYPQSPDILDLDEVFMNPIPMFNSVVVDLPQYVETKQQNNANAFASLEDAYQAHEQILDVAYKILREGGILVYKTTDFLLDGKQQWISDFAIRKAESLGFELIDKFIYIIYKKLMRRHSNQLCAAKSHAFFFVFRKPATDSE